MSGAGPKRPHHGKVRWQVKYRARREEKMLVCRKQKSVLARAGSQVGGLRFKLEHFEERLV